MNKRILLLFVFTLVLFACKRDKQSMLIRKWHAISFDNPQMDEYFKEGQEYIDTVGKTADAQTNEQLYGTSNMDSVRHVLQSRLDSVKGMQVQNVQDTWFDFRKNGLAILNFSGSIDSTKWYFDDDGNLMLDELKLKGSGDRIKMNIIELNDTLLKLKFVENGAMGTVTFHPEQN
ncbi:MAG TPA: hypothetical protein VN721_13335 [Flavipsychrobacter sp.]|nr:hypothetical protein [Flavipsychrobacter sp.]